jgi:hypothetical protein
VEDEQAFVMMPARTLMAMTLGESLFLNPKLPSGNRNARLTVFSVLNSVVSESTICAGGSATSDSSSASPCSRRWKTNRLS